MPPIPSRRSSRSDHLLRLGGLALRFGTEASVQWWTIASRSWGYEADRLVRDAVASVPPELLLRNMVSGYVNCLGELAAIAPSVAEKVAMEATRPFDAGLAPIIGDEHAGPEPEGEIFEVGGKPFAMPARVLDASQGWAMYFVDIKAANDALGPDVRDILSAFDTGGGRTPLMIIGVDYRNSDFGVYPELVVALTVTAKDDPAGQLFSYYLAIVVTQEFTKEAASIVWGLEKTVAPRLEIRYAADNVRFAVHNAKGRAFSIRFPRFGDARSSDQPTFSISRRGAGSERRTYWAMTTKSGSGEGTQIGGSVQLEFGTPGDDLSLGADGKSVGLSEMLRGFDIADRLPAANGWTERQTAVFGPPRLLDFPR